MTIDQPHAASRMGRAPGDRAPAAVLVAALVTSCLLLCSAAGAAPGSTPPTSGPRSRPGALPGALPDERPQGLKSFAQRLAEAIEPNDTERIVLAATRDRIGSIDQTDRYVMLALAARAPTPDAVEWEQLDRPAYVNLLRDPVRYRARPMRMRLRVYRVWKLLPGAGLVFSPFWKRDRPVWEMDCIWSSVPYSREKPLKVFSIVNPDEFLGEPDERQPDGEMTYRRGPELRAAGLFHKVYRKTERGSGRLRDYPVVVVWDITRTVGTWPRGGWGGWGLTQTLPVLLLVIVLIGAFVLTKRRLGRLRGSDRSAARGEYRPLRRERGRREPPPSDTDANEADEPVDPNLAAAVEDFLQDKQRDDAPPERRRRERQDDDAADDRG